MTKNQDHMDSHMMELPRQIVIGEKNIDDFGQFLHNLTKPKKVSLISGIHVKKILKQKIEKSLKNKKIMFVWHTSKDNQFSTLKKIQRDVKKDHSDIIAGIGGGRSVDTAKMVAFNLDIPFVSVDGFTIELVGEEKLPFFSCGQRREELFALNGIRLLKLYGN